MRWRENRIDRVPLVWWAVTGRRLFDRSYSAVIRRSWKVGAYSKSLAVRQARIERATENQR